MEYLRYVLLMAILVLSTTIGILISKKYSERLKELIEIKKSLNIIKTKIKFTYETMPDIFSQMIKMTDGNVQELFRKASEKIKETSAQSAWEESVDELISNFTKEDKEVIKTFGKELRND